MLGSTGVSGDLRGPWAFYPIQEHFSQCKDYTLVKVSRLDCHYNINVITLFMVADF